MPFLLCPFHLFPSADLLKFVTQVRVFSYEGLHSSIAVLPLRVRLVKLPHRACNLNAAKAGISRSVRLPCH
jgi:hypothetical protein